MLLVAYMLPALRLTALSILSVLVWGEFAALLEFGPMDTRPNLISDMPALQSPGSCKSQTAPKQGRKPAAAVLHPRYKERESKDGRKLHLGDKGICLAICTCCHWRSWIATANILMCKAFQSRFAVNVDLPPLNSCCLVLQVFVESSMPVIKHYEGKGKVRRFDATPPPSELFEKVKKLFVQTPASVL